MRDHLIDGLDRVMRHVLFAYKFQFIKFEKVNDLQGMKAFDFLKVLHYYFHSEDGVVSPSAVQQEDQEGKDLIINKVPIFNKALQNSWNRCVLVLEIVSSIDQEQVIDDKIFHKGKLIDITYQVVKIHKKHGPKGIQHDAYFPCQKANKSQLGGNSKKLSNNVSASFMNHLMWDAFLSTTLKTDVKVNVY